MDDELLRRPLEEQYAIDEENEEEDGKLMKLMAGDKSTNTNKYALDFEGRISEENSSADD